MSGRRRRPEALWDRKEDDEISGGRNPWQGKESQSNICGDGSPKLSNSEANDAFMPRDFSREPMHGNENMPADPAFNEWENQYSSRPSDHYGLPYRGGDRGLGGAGNINKDQDRSRSRSWSPPQSRGRDRDRDRDRGNVRGRERSSRSRSRGRDPGSRGRSPYDDERREYESADVRNDSRVSSRSSRGGANRSDNDSTEKWSKSEYSGGSRFRDDRTSADRPRTKGSDGYRKDTTRNRNSYDDQDHRRQWNQTTKPTPCRYFLMGNCHRSNCKFSHDAPKPVNNDKPWNERQPQDHTSATQFPDFEKSNRNIDENNKLWNGPTWDEVESGRFNQASRLDAMPQNVIPEPSGSQFTNATATTVPQVDTGIDLMANNSNAYNLVPADTSQQFRSYDSMTSQFPSTLNGTEKSSAPKLQMNGAAQGMFSHLDLQKPVEVQNQQGGGEPLETSKSDTPASLPSQKQILANALELLYSLPNPNATSSGAPVDSTIANESKNTTVPISNPSEPGNVEAVGVPKTKHEPIGEKSVTEKREVENPKGPGKSETQGKVEESNDEKAMRQFKVALVEFVKDILKPTWKEGKMSREVYKTIVKKVVDKVTSTIQGIQIPRTQEKIDQYLAFSKSKITKLVEAYVGRFLKA